MSECVSECVGVWVCGRGTFDAYPPARDFAGYYMAAFEQVVSE